MKHKRQAKTIDEYLAAVSEDKRVEAYKDELKNYDTSKGAIRFPPDNPLPPTLVRKLVKARIAKNAAQQKRAALVVGRRR